MLFQLLSERATHYPNKAAIIGESRTVTYRELYSEAANAAVYLQSFGITSGQPIILGMPPSPEFHAALFGVSALGLPSITVLPSGKISSHVAQAQPAVAIGDSAFLSAASERCPSLRYSLEVNPNRRGEYLYTGDLGRIDPAGYIYVVGRKSHYQSWR